MMTRLAQLTAATLLVVGAAGCFGGGGQVSSPCDAPTDDEPTAVVVSSMDPAAPDVIRGCIDSGTDADTIVLSRPGSATGTWTFSVRCQVITGATDFDTPAIIDPGTPCVATNPPYYATGNQTSSTVTLTAHAGGEGGEYRLEILVGQD